MRAVTWAVALWLVLLGGAAHGAERGSAAEAQAMVGRAVLYLQQHGRQKALEEFNRPQGQFRDRDLYLVVFDLQGNGLAHLNPRLVGKATGDIRDADGKQIFQAQRALALDKGRGWVDYKWPNPQSGKIERKSTWLEKSGDLIIMCGIYQ